MGKRKVDKLVIDNFKSIRHLELELRDINILIGANGVGKSNFIAFFRMLNSFVEKEFQRYVRREGGANNLLYFGRKNSEFIEGKVYFYPNSYEFKLIPDNQDTLFFEYERVGFWTDYEYWDFDYIGRNTYESNLLEASRKRGKWWSTSKSYYVYNSMKTWRVYHFHDTSNESPMRRACNINDNKFFKYNAANLPAFLYLLQHKYEKNFKQIERNLRKIAPFFDRFVLERDRLNNELIRLEWKHKDSDEYFNASHLSDGTLRMLCLLTLLLQPDEFLPSTILIDEPELGLHPAAIELFSELIKITSKKTQIVMSTQSATLISHFDPEDIIVVDVEDNQSVFRRLDKKELEQWLEEYSLGELWEKNILGGRP